MQNELFEQWNKTSMESYDAFKELAGITSKIAEKFSNQQIEMANACMEASVKSFTLASESKGYKDLMSGQASLVSELNDQALGFARSATSLMSETKDELTAWAEKGIQAGSAK